MQRSVRVDIPDDFFDQITTDELADYLIRKGFMELKPQANKYVRSFVINMEYIDIVEMERCEERSFLMRLNFEKYSDITHCDFIELIQDFGWGKCQTCNAYDVTQHCMRNVIGNRRAEPNFGCIHYEFKQRYADQWKTQKRKRRKERKDGFGS